MNDLGPVWFRGVSVFISQCSIFITQTQNPWLITQTPLSLKNSNTFVWSQNLVMYLSFYLHFLPKWWTHPLTLHRRKWLLPASSNLATSKPRSTTTNGKPFIHHHQPSSTSTTTNDNPKIHNHNHNHHHQQPLTQPQPPPKNLNESKIQTHQQPSTKCVWFKNKKRKRKKKKRQVSPRYSHHRVKKKKKRKKKESAKRRNQSEEERKKKRDPNHGKGFGLMSTVKYKLRSTTKGLVWAWIEDPNHELGSESLDQRWTDLG